MSEIPKIDVIRFETFRGTYSVTAEGMSEDSRRRCLEKIEEIVSIQRDKKPDVEETKGRYRMTPEVLLAANKNNF